MEKFILGSGDAALEVTQMGFGCMGLTAFYGKPTPDAEAIAVLRHAFDLGVRFFDTAQVYMTKLPDGTILSNEELVGKFLKTLRPEERAEVIVATKFHPMNLMTQKLEWSEEYFIQATQMSMQKLGVECIDLYYFHRVYPTEICDVQTWMSAAKRLKEKGWIKHIGLSEAAPEVIREAHAVSPITCVQQEWSLFARDLEDSVVPVCKELGIGIVAYSPVGRGILAGSFSHDTTISDWRKTVPYLTEANIKKNLDIIEQIKQVAAGKNCSVSQICLAWVMKKGSVPIPGTTKISHLEDNVKAVNVELSEEDMKTLEDLASQVVGERGDEAYMKRTFHNNKKL